MPEPAEGRVGGQGGEEKDQNLPHRDEDRRLGFVLGALGVLAGSHAARQVEANVVMHLNEQGQEQLRVDPPHPAHAAVD